MVQYTRARQEHHHGLLRGQTATTAGDENPTLVVVTDRNDLDGQLFSTFCAGDGLLKTTPLQAGSRRTARYVGLASGGGIIFTTVQKNLPC